MSWIRKILDILIIAIPIILVISTFLQKKEIEIDITENFSLPTLFNRGGDKSSESKDDETKKENKKGESGDLKKPAILSKYLLDNEEPDSETKIEKEIETKPESLLKEELIREEIESTFEKKLDENENGNGNRKIKPLESKRMQCKFVNTKQCPANYPQFMGASFGITGGADISLSCNGTRAKGLDEEAKAEAMAVIHDGKINRVRIIKKGRGYEKEPAIKVTGGSGTNAKLVSKIDDNGSVVAVEVVNGGVGYISTPDITIDAPTLSQNCYLCCENSV